MIGSSISFPNTQYQCCECGRNLEINIQGLKAKQPTVIIINDKQYCIKCADKHWDYQIKRM